MMRERDWTPLRRRRARFATHPLRRGARTRTSPFSMFGFAVVFVVIIIIVVAIIAIAATGASHVAVQKSVTCTVTGKDRSSDSDGNSIYRVYTSGGENCTTFEVSDSVFFGNYNTADLYGSLQEGKKYSLEVSGVRNGFLSLFPNIRSAKEVTE